MQFRLMSPGTGAYRVQLFQVSGEDGVEVMLVGEGDEMRVDLSPGEYAGHVLQLGQPTETGRRFKLQLRLNEPDVRFPVTPTDTLTFSSRSRVLGPAIRSTRLPRISQLTETRSLDRDIRGQDRLIDTPLQPTIRSADFSVETMRLLQRLRGGDGNPSVSYTGSTSGQEIGETPGGLMPRMSAERTSFSIGISEDRSPEEHGSWTRPSLVEILAQTMDDGFRFRVNQREERMPENGYRVRMTVGIAGIPAIRIPIPVYAEGSIIEVRPVRIGDQPDFAVDIRAIDDRVQALVAGLTELSGEDALKILRWNAESQIDDAIRILAEKQRDLWAATAAALLLVKTRRLEGVEQWPLNLSRLAPHIADAAIAAAWARAARGTGGRRRTEQSVMKFLSQGLSVGAPTFSVGNSLALEMLNVLRNSAQDREIQSAARDAYVRLARRSRYKIYRGPYMLWEQTGNQLQSGRLLGPRYLELVRGVM